MTTFDITKKFGTETNINKNMSNFVFLQNPLHMQTPFVRTCAPRREMRIQCCHMLNMMAKGYGKDNK